MKFIQCPKYLGWSIRGSARALPAILANKMEENLRNLADLLGECSRLVSQVLAGSSSSSNGNVTDSAQLHKGYQEITSVQRATFPGLLNELGPCCKEVEVQDCVLA